MIKENMEEYIRSLSRMTTTDKLEDDLDFIDEAGNISSGIAIKKHNDVIKLGREVLRSRESRSVDKLLAKMIVATSGLSLMSIAVSGDKSFASTIAKGASLRGI